MNDSKNSAGKMLFMQLVSMLAISAIQQMGEAPDKSGKKGGPGLEGAQAMIDTLDMLEEKTQGNLDSEESKLLKDTLISLKMNYVKAEEGRKKTAEPVGDTPAPEKKPAEGGGEKAPKYRKSYG